jgi:hypothetical protein
MKKTMIRSLSKIAGLGILTIFVLTIAATANAQCGGSFETLMSAISLSRGQTRLIKQPVDSLKSSQDQLVADKSAVNPSIVGLWRIKFIIDTPDGPATFQEAFQAWNTGGTEVHNPKVDPRGGSVCLGSWVQAAPLTFNLAHRVWIYDSAGNFQVLVHLTESLTLSERGNTQSGTFSLQPVDDNDNPLGDPLTGTVEGVRISPN